MKRRNLWLGIGAGAFLLTIVACGGGGGDARRDREVEVYAYNRRIADFQVHVSPRNGSFNDRDACTETSVGFGCERNLTDNFTAYRFRTDPRSATDPYILYLRNLSGSTRNVDVDVYMDGRFEYGVTAEVFDGETLPTVRIYQDFAEAYSNLRNQKVTVRETPVDPKAGKPGQFKR